MDRVITRRALVKGGLIAGALVPVAGLFISVAAYADLPALDPSDPAARGRDYVAKSVKSVPIAGIVRSIRRREIPRVPARSSRERA